MLDVVVARRLEAARGIVALELASASGERLPVFSAGAHVDVHLGNGLVRPYSLCGAPGVSDRYRIAVLREEGGRGGSMAVHGLTEGERLKLGLPRNLFSLDPHARRSLLFAGGIGITPMLAMAYELHARGQSFELHYSARSRQAAAFVAELEQAPFAKQVHLYLSDDPSGVGRRLDMDAAVGASEPGTHLYVCGPQRFIDGLRQTAKARQWPDASVHFESFGGVDLRTANDGGFEVELGRSGRVIPVLAQQSVVEALAAQGVEIPTSCEQGVCGTCLTGVLKGRPDHRDVFLTDAERDCNDQFLPCCSRALDARLVLDL